MKLKRGIIFIVGTIAVLCFASGLLSGAILFHDGSFGEMRLQGTMSEDGMTDKDLIGHWHLMDVFSSVDAYYTFRDDNTVRLMYNGEVLPTLYWHSKVIGDGTPNKGFEPIYHNGNKLSSVYAVWITEENVEPQGRPDLVLRSGNLYTLKSVPSTVYHLELDLEF